MGVDAQFEPGVNEAGVAGPGSTFPASSAAREVPQGSDADVAGKVASIVARQSASAQSSPETGRIEAQIAELTKPGSAYWNKDDAGHAKAVSDVASLHAQLEQAQQPGAKESGAQTIANPPAGWSTPDEAAGRALAAALGLPADVVDGAVKAVLAAGPSRSYATAAECEAAAQAAFGVEFDVRLANAKLAVEAVGPDFKAYLNRTGLGNSLPLMKYLSDVGAKLADAKSGIERMQNDPAYTDAGHVKHKEAVAEVQRLYKVLSLGASRDVTRS